MADDLTRRDLVKRLPWVVPVIMTFTVTPTFAKNGSGDYHKAKPGNHGRRLGWVKHTTP